MGQDSRIEWTTHTFNPWVGCTKVGPGCAHCYAERWAKRSGLVQWGPNAGRRRTRAANWRAPRRWAAAGAAAARRPRVFCASLADVFDDQVPVAWRTDLWALIRETPDLDWIIVTKRIAGAAALLPPDWGDGWPQVWLLATVCGQDEAERDVPRLLATPSARRGLSCEPLLGPIALRQLDAGGPAASVDALTGRWAGGAGHVTTGPRLDWVIAGGESGPNARPMHPRWVRALRDDCQAAGVAFFFKQWGEWGPAELVSPAPAARHARIALPPDDTAVYRLGRRRAGRALDGRTWDQLPSGPPSGRDGHPGADTAGSNHAVGDR